MSARTAFGANRVVHPKDSLPQSADELDPSSPIQRTEARVRVERLNLDSASFKQIRDANQADPASMSEQILDIVARRGKMQNPMTGSGGVLIGEVVEVGDAFTGDASVGDRIVTLVSLTATPLSLESIADDWLGDSPVVPVTGRAVLTNGAIFAVLPRDISESVALAVLDVCGAPALTRRILECPSIDGKTRSSVLILGGGKSASLSAVAAREAGADVTVLVPVPEERDRLIEHRIADRVVVADATDPLTTRNRVQAALAPHGFPDLTVVCVNVPGVEHTALVCTRPGGAVIYFSMATSFSAVALGAEALGLDLDLIVGSGYVPGHADAALQLIRDHAGLREFFATL